MGHRLTRIYTRTGDHGETGLGDGSRVPKTHPRVEAMGDVDELNSCIGLLAASAGLPAPLPAILEEVQHDLFDLGGELSMPGASILPSGRTAALEGYLDTLNDALPPLKDFILPGGSEATARCHLARAVCRRAERRLVSVRAGESNDRLLRDVLLTYLNRLSDLLFVMARTLARAAGSGEVLWRANAREAARGGTASGDGSDT